MKTTPLIKRLFASACTAITLATLATASFAPSASAEYYAEDDMTLEDYMSTYTGSVMAPFMIMPDVTVTIAASYIDTFVMNDGTLEITGEGNFGDNVRILGGTVKCTAETCYSNSESFDEINTLSLTGGTIRSSLSDVDATTIEIASGATVSSAASYIDTDVTNYGTLEITNEGVMTGDVTTEGGTLKCTWETYETNQRYINFGFDSTLSLTGGTITSSLSDVGATIEIASGKTVTSNASNIDYIVTISDGATLTLTDGTLVEAAIINLGGNSTLNLNNVTIDGACMINSNGSSTQISATDVSLNPSYVSMSENTIVVHTFDNGYTSASVDLNGSLAITLGMSESELVDFAKILDEYGTTTFNLAGVDEENLTDISLAITNADGVVQYSYSWGDFTVSTDATGLSLTVDNPASVPEPSTATLSLLALAGLCARRRRCRQA